MSFLPECHHFFRTFHYFWFNLSLQIILKNKSYNHISKGSLECLPVLSSLIYLPSLFLLPPPPPPLCPSVSLHRLGRSPADPRPLFSLCLSVSLHRCGKKPSWSQVLVSNHRIKSGIRKSFKLLTSSWVYCSAQTEHHVTMLSLNSSSRKHGLKQWAPPGLLALNESVHP